jgi:hypothetical protein
MEEQMAEILTMFLRELKAIFSKQLNFNFTTQCLHRTFFCSFVFGIY